MPPKMLRYTKRIYNNKQLSILARKSVSESPSNLGLFLEHITAFIELLTTQFICTWVKSGLVVSYFKFSNVNFCCNLLYAAIHTSAKVRV